MTSAEIITIGTELLLGEITDTNTRFIARALRSVGVDLFRTQMIGDNPGRIAGAIREASSRAQIIITTGGLGPTVDDPTRQAAAEAAGLKLEYREDLWEQIKRRVIMYGRVPGENQKRQAWVPQGARIVENPVGTAPAFIIETPQNAIICLPGVPQEMETLLTLDIIPFLQERFELHELIKIRTLHVSGVGEAWVDEQVGELEELSNPTVGLAAHSGMIDVRIAAKAGCEAEAQTLIASIESQIRTRLGNAIFGADEETLEEVSLRAVAQRGWKLALIESGLSGIWKAQFADRKSPVIAGVESIDHPAGGLLMAAETARLKYHADIVLVVDYTTDTDEQKITLFLLSTSGNNEEKRLFYGGIPRNAPRWVMNMALDFLRRAAVT